MANEYLRARRRATPSPSGSGKPMTQAEPAEAVNRYVWTATGRQVDLDVATLSRYERGLISWPSADYREGLRAALGVCTDADLGFRSTTRGKPDARRRATVQNAALAGLDADLRAAEERIRWVITTDASEDLLTGVANSVLWIIDHNERIPASELLLRARELRPRMSHLMEGSQHPRSRARVYTAAAYLAGTQATLALDLSHLPLARTLAREAFELAVMGTDQDLIAWARAAQSLVEYYDGRYGDAAAYARDGVERSPRGKHAVRLSVNGIARALARIGDRNGVARAVGHAWDVLEDHQMPSDEVTSSMTTGVYCAARVAGNAATAYLALGSTTAVARFGSEALSRFDAASTPGPRAMTRLDLAMALLRQEDPDIEGSAELVREALAVNDDPPFPVRQRVAEFLHAAQPWQALPAVKDVRELISTRTPN